MKTTVARPMLVVLSAGAVYLAAGVIFGALAGAAASHQAVVGWRLAAWVVSGVAFTAHVLYEQVRLRSPLTMTARRAASGAALAAFGLAAAAIMHAMIAGAHPPFMLKLSLAIWPIMITLPAFFVALVMAAMVARFRSA
jgi:hypothetical protein